MRRRRLFGDRRVREHGDPSGLAVAERAHDRRKVRPAPEPLPRHVMHITLTLETDRAGETAEQIGASLLNRDVVLSCGWSVVSE